MTLDLSRYEGDVLPPGYRFECGIVYSMTGWRGHAERPLTPRVDDHGYEYVSVTCNGKTQKRHIHRLVAHAFHGPRPPGMQVRHLDGNKRNNAPANLAWGTAKENADDRARHGTTCRGAHSRAVQKRVWETKEHPTHCPKGHPYGPDNLKFTPQGWRYCAQCNRDRAAITNPKRKSAAAIRAMGARG